MFRPGFSGIPRSRGAILELPTTHRVPVSWLREHASPPIKWRTVNDILPPGAATEEDYAALREEVLGFKGVTQIIRKQYKAGVWADNILGLSANKAQGIKDVGTVAQFRRLVECGVPTSERPLRLAERVLYRLLSRDDDPTLLFEYKTAAKKNPELAVWARTYFREGAVVSLAHAGHEEDPRVRGGAHRMASEISQFLRSDLVEKPIVRKGNRNILHPDAYPPTTMSLATFAYMPSLQRERAGFIERLCTFLAQPQPKKKYTIVLGRKVIQPTYHLLGNPIEVDRSGRPKDLPLALHWIELLVRMGMLHTNEPAHRALEKMLQDLDANGIWSPSNLRAIPKSSSKLADFAFPLEPDAKTMERRQADVTFRLAMIAKLAGWQLEYT